MLSVAFQTLGCKLNQGETETIAAAFANAGFSIAADAGEAELLVVNTCAVTSKAEQKGRRLIRAALRRKPSQCVIVTGCYAGFNQDSLEALDPSVSSLTRDKRRLFVVPSTQSCRMLDIPPRIAGENPHDEDALQNVLARFCAGETCAPANARDNADAFSFEMTDKSRRSRCFLKIQDGCDNSCAYCFVRIARGKARSLPLEDALERLRAVENAGTAEVVLTGVNICQWSGVVNGAKAGLDGLIKKLLAGTSTTGIRLSSLEPDVFSEDFFETLRHPRVKPHFHLSIQSGCAETLKRMNRLYEPGAALRAIQRLRDVKDDPFIACDVITGFPGETEACFLETLNFCVTADFAQIHAFPFSRRPGTAAWDYKPRVPEREAEKRVRILKDLAAKNRKSYIERWIGREIDGICLSDADTAAQTGVIEILTGNYLRIHAAGGKFDARKGRRILCKITGFAVGGTDAYADVRADACGEIIGE
ncbi:MAG: radical SAM protein [Spirochaetaceae bacterium]|nr:radical SAM protein [Spirochaetaceae bacterium]